MTTSATVYTVHESPRITLSFHRGYGSVVFSELMIDNERGPSCPQANLMKDNFESRVFRSTVCRLLATAGGSIFEPLVWDYFFHLLRTDRYVRAFVKSKAPKFVSGFRLPKIGKS